MKNNLKRLTLIITLCFSLTGLSINAFAAKSSNKEELQKLNQAFYALQTSATPSRLLMRDVIDILNLTNQQQYLAIKQSFNQMESPSQAYIEITRSGLLDDAIEGIQFQLTLGKKPEYWEITELKRLFLCRRTSNHQYQTKLCL